MWKGSRANHFTARHCESAPTMRNLSYFIRLEGWPIVGERFSV
jgi:hypothetical protein